MARPIPDDQDDAVLEALRRAPQGAGMEQIEAALSNPPPRRTLQRRMAALVAQGRVRMVGQRRAARYFSGNVVHGSGRQIFALTTTLRAEIRIPLSHEAQDVERIVRRPPTSRQPVGYDRAFLESYRPNTTFYLPATTRAELLAAGRVADADTPAGTYARHIWNRLLIDLSWNSSRLEGNTYSLLETERLLSAGEAAQGRDALETQMIVNHKAAIEFLVDSAGEIGFDRYTVLNLHALLADNLLADPTASGRLRGIAVGIAGTVFHPLEGPQRIEECFEQILDTATAIADPFEQALFVMVQLPYLQAFEDINKRVSRLAANIPLIRQNLCPLSFVDVPQQAYIDAMIGIYELRRIDLLRDIFVWAYKRSCARYSAVRQSIGEPDPFRLRYRQVVAEAVTEIVRGQLEKRRAIALIRERAELAVPEPDRARFVEVAETELMSLHEGNIARYRLRPSEYLAWREIWK